MSVQPGSGIKSPCSFPFPPKGPVTPDFLKSKPKQEMRVKPDYTLSEAQRVQFMEYGFVKIEKCFTKAQAAEFTKDMWPRLGFSPTDKATWTVERSHMSGHRVVSVSEFAPKAWAAMCQLLGGEERIESGDGEKAKGWSDAFIVNLGKPEYKAEEKLDLRKDLWGWHNDGDFFVHFLDSREQALLVIPLWSDIVPKGGGTVVCTDGIKHIAKHLYDHPEGVTPWLKSVNEPGHDDFEGGDFWNELAKDESRTRDESFFEMVGETGDVILMHPFMLHSASKNLRRDVRIITNPPVSLKQPFCFDRKNKDEYSLVELKTLKDLGMPDGLPGWKTTGSRRGWTSQRMRKQEELKRKELERMKKE